MRDTLLSPNDSSWPYIQKVQCSGLTAYVNHIERKLLTDSGANLSAFSKNVIIRTRISNTLKYMYMPVHGIPIQMQTNILHILMNKY